MSARTYELHAESYSLSDIQNYFERLTPEQ